MRKSCDSVSNEHWRSKHAKCNQVLNVQDTTARHDLLRIREAQYGQSISLISKSKTLHVHLIVLSTLLCHNCMTTTWKCLTSRFIEDVNKRRRTFFPYEFVYIWQNKRLVIIAKKNETMRIYFLFKSDVLTAIAAVVLEALTRGGKKILPVTVLDPSVVVRECPYYIPMQRYSFFFSRFRDEVYLGSCPPKKLYST